jgi:hypothetical protein
MLIFIKPYRRAIIYGFKKLFISTPQVYAIQLKDLSTAKTKPAVININAVHPLNVDK